MDTIISEEIVCRLCAAPMEHISDENDLFQITNLCVHQQIKELAGLVIENEPELPRYFCLNCRENLTQACEFRKNLILVHKYFKKDYRNNLQKQEMAPSTDAVFDTVYMPEKSEEEHIVGAADIFCDVKDEEFDTMEEFPNAVEETTVVKTKKIKKAKTFRKYKRKKLKKAELDTTVKTFICEQCGMSFKTMKFLEIHSVRHEEKKFQCEICAAKFFLPTELKRHMISHTGGKQVSCRFCDTRFLNKSNRNRHEKSQHLKLRPFPCELCGKAFANTHLRKNHMVVHTKERAFNCYICQKSFLRKNHLVTHYKSTAHKNNEMDADNSEIQNL